MQPVHDEHDEYRVNGESVGRGQESKRDDNRLNADERHELEQLRAAERVLRYGHHNGTSRRRKRWCRWGLECREWQSKTGCNFGHRGPPVRYVEQVDDQQQADVEFNEDMDAQSEKFESQDGEPDGEQCVDDNSDGASASTNAEEYDDTNKEDAQFSQSDEEDTQVPNQSDEYEQLSNEQNTPIESDDDGPTASQRDEESADDGQDVHEQPGSQRNRRWQPQCRYGDDCRRLQQGNGCSFHHTAEQMMNASRRDRRLEPHSEQWKPMAVSGKVTLSDLIDELMATGTDFTKFEDELGWRVEELLQKMRAATPAERTAADGYHIVRGIMQVTGETGVTQEIVVLIDGCAAKSMASMDVKMTITGKSKERFRGATSTELVRGQGVGNITVHTTEGVLNLVEVHQVEAMQSGQVIVSVFQLVKAFGDMFGLSVKGGKMAMFIPTSSASATQRTRYGLEWHDGLMKLANVVCVTATGGSDGVAVFTTGSYDSETGGNVHAVHTVSPRSSRVSTRIGRITFRGWSSITPRLALRAG